LPFVAALIVGQAPTAIADGPATIRDALKEVLPEIEVDNVSPSPIAGLYEVMVGTQLMYVTGDGRYFVDGRIVDLEKREDLTEPRLAEARLRATSKIGEDQMIIFDPDDEVRHTVTVFTDIDCGYCRKLHQEMDGYNDEGIRIRYLFYPRAGKGSPSYEKAVSVWCADDRRAAMTAAKAGEKIPSEDCDTPIDQHVALGQSLAIRGTPALLLDSGDLVPGYVEPKRLAALLDQAEAQ
jgi:thiol:disulfide interchange protein DsbC